MADLPRLLPQKGILEGNDDFPRVSSELIDLLDKSFPHRCLRLGEDVSEHHRYAGVREMIDELIEWRNEALYGSDDPSLSEV